MKHIKCLNCGHDVKVDERTSTGGNCPACGCFVKLDGEALIDAEKFKEAFSAECNAAKDDYVNGLPAKMNSLLANFKSKWESPEFPALWRGFVVECAQEAQKKGDKKVFENLKVHAHEYDLYCTGLDVYDVKKLAETPLYKELSRAYPDFFNGSDWYNLFDNDKDDDSLRDDLNFLLAHIEKNKDVKLAVEIFRKLAKRGEEGKNACKMYIYGLDSKVTGSDGIFSVKNIDARRAKLIRDINRYFQKYFPTETDFKVSKLWQNYSQKHAAALKKGIKTAVIVLAVIIIAAAGGSTGYGIWRNSPDSDTIVFNVEHVIELTYGEEPNLSGCTFTYKKHSGEVVTKPVTRDMLNGYDPENVGAQQTVYVEFGKKQTVITIRIYPAQLSVPQVVRQGNNISWEAVPNAKGFDVYVGSYLAVRLEATQLSYDLSGLDDKFFGNLTVMVRANASGDEPESNGKYSNSALSEGVDIVKLKTPSNLSYTGGVLSWEPVEGAADYLVTVNGNTQTRSTPSFPTALVQGDNSIVIVARSSDPNAVDGVLRTTLSYSKLDAVSSLVYTGGRINWNECAGATTYEVWVNGNLWKEFGTNWFDVAEEFTPVYGDGINQVGIVCKSSLLGVEASDMAAFDVCTRSRIRREDDAIAWEAVPADAVYEVTVNGATYTLTSPRLSISQFSPGLGIGANELSVTAKAGNQRIICETVKIVKLGIPEISVSGGEWVTDGDTKNLYALDKEEWSPTLPPIAGLAPGGHVVRAKKVGTDFEFDSETVEITVNKPDKPSIKIANEQIACYNQAEGYDLALYKSSVAEQTGIRINSLLEITEEGVWYIRAMFTGKNGTEAGVYFTDSEPSEPLQVVKLKAPLLKYDEERGLVTLADGEESGEIKIFYTDTDGTEKELIGGLTENLPRGMFEIYARRIARADNELTSENTPAALRPQVMNLNISLVLTIKNQNSLTATFRDFADMGEITFTYKLIYKKDGVTIGQKQSGGQMTVTADSPSQVLNYSMGVTFEPGYGIGDVTEIEMVATLSGNSQGQNIRGSVTIR